MTGFCMADMQASGDLRSVSKYSYETLERLPGCAELIGTLSGRLWQSPEHFEAELADTPGDLGLRWWSTAATAGLMTLRSAERVVSVTVLASGRAAEADGLTIDALQRQLVGELHGTEHEAAFALTELRDRPLAATINICSPSDPALQAIAAVADRCFAAAYFRYLRLL